MTYSKISLGKKGEELAAVFLKKHGYKVLEMNFRIRLGEIDIIAIHKKTLCFVEVKTRTSNAFGTPLESISKRKQRKLTMTALAYISARKITETNMRFDIVTVMPDSSGGYECELYQNAFECDNV